MRCEVHGLEFVQIYDIIDGKILYNSMKPLEASRPAQMNTLVFNSTMVFWFHEPQEGLVKLGSRNMFYKLDSALLGFKEVGLEFATVAASNYSLFVIGKDVLTSQLKLWYLSSEVSEPKFT